MFVAAREERRQILLRKAENQRLKAIRRRKIAKKHAKTRATANKRAQCVTRAAARAIGCVLSLLGHESRLCVWPGRIATGALLPARPTLCVSQLRVKSGSVSLTRRARHGFQKTRLTRYACHDFLRCVAVSDVHYQQMISEETFAMTHPWHLEEWYARRQRRRQIQAARA